MIVQETSTQRECTKSVQTKTTCRTDAQSISARTRCAKVSVGVAHVSRGITNDVREPPHHLNSKWLFFPSFRPPPICITAGSENVVCVDDETGPYSSGHNLHVNYHVRTLQKLATFFIYHAPTHPPTHPPTLFACQLISPGVPFPVLVPNYDTLEPRPLFPFRRYRTKTVPSATATRTPLLASVLNR